MSDKKEVPFLDKVGRIVMPGHLVVYGVAYGRSAGLAYGVVLGSHNVEKSRYDHKAACWLDTPYPHLTVHGCDHYFGGEARLNGKKSTLQFQERVLIVDRDQVPDDILKLLDTVKIPG